jgi:hypothetical protein
VTSLDDGADLSFVPSSFDDGSAAMRGAAASVDEAADGYTAVQGRASQSLSQWAPALPVAETLDRVEATLAAGTRQGAADLARTGDLLLMQKQVLLDSEAANVARIEAVTSDVRLPPDIDGAAGGAVPGDAGEGQPVIPDDDRYVAFSRENAPPELFDEMFGELREVNIERRQELGWKNNCMACVGATDHALAGHPTCAMPYPESGWPVRCDIIIPQQLSHGVPFREVGTFDEITRELADAGDGARGVVWGHKFVEVDGKMKETNGHIFNVVNKNGRVYYVDGQSATWAGTVSKGYGELGFLRTN